MKVKLAILVLLIVSTTTAIAYEPPVGTWEWLEYQETSTSHTYPVDVGYTIQWAFLDDGTYMEYMDEILVVFGDYIYGESEYMGMMIPYVRITINGVATTYAYTVYPEDVLTIYYGADVGGWPYYPIDIYARRTAVVAADQSSWGAVKLLFH